jgi:hypothetical protein
MYSPFLFVKEKELVCTCYMHMLYILAYPSTKSTGITKGVAETESIKGQLLLIRR